MKIQVHVVFPKLTRDSHCQLPCMLCMEERAKLSYASQTSSVSFNDLVHAYLRFGKHG